MPCGHQTVGTSTGECRPFMTMPPRSVLAARAAWGSGSAGKLLSTGGQPGRPGAGQGQVLARLDGQDLRLGVEAAARAALNAAQVQLDLALADLRRYRELREQGFIGAAELDRREASVRRRHKSQLDQAKCPMGRARQPGGLCQRWWPMQPAWSPPWKPSQARCWPLARRWSGWRYDGPARCGVQCAGGPPGRRLPCAGRPARRAVKPAACGDRMPMNARWWSARWPPPRTPSPGPSRSRPMPAQRAGAASGRPPAVRVAGAAP